MEAAYVERRWENVSTDKPFGVAFSFKLCLSLSLTEADFLSQRLQVVTDFIFTAMGELIH